jgi:hypothetical protein
VKKVNMSDRLSRKHQALLWLVVVQGVLGLAFLAAPDRILETASIIAPVEINIVVRVVGAFLVAAALTAGFALRTDSWAQTRLFTWFVAAAYLMIVIIRGLAVATDTAGWRWQVGVVELVFGVGFAWESVRRMRDSHPLRQTPGPASTSEAPVS